MAKIVFFIIILIMVFPLFFMNEKFKTVKNSNVIKPPIEIIKGNFEKYNPVLEITGSFEKLNFFKDYLEIEALSTNDILKNEHYFAKWALNKKDKIEAKDVKYQNSDYNLSTTKAVYLKKEKILKGGKFNFYSLDARGKGNSFIVDKDKNIFAENITYYIKVKE